MTSRKSPPRTRVVLPSRQFSSSSSPDTPRTRVVLPSPQFSSSSSPDTPRTQVVLATRQFSSSSSPDTRAHGTSRPLACFSRTRRSRSPQRVAHAWDNSHSRLHFAHSTRTISAEGCARTAPIALSPALRALDTHDLRRGLRGNFTNRPLACFSRTRRSRSPQRVARTWDKSPSRLHFAHSTRTISAEGCAGTGQIALSPAFRALDTHDLRRGLHFRLTLFVPPSAFKREFIKWGDVFSLGHLPCKFSILILAYLHWGCTGILAYFCTWILTLAYLGCFLPLRWDTYRRVCVQVSVWQRQCSSVSVEMSVFKCKCGNVSV